MHIHKCRGLYTFVLRIFVVLYHTKAFYLCLSVKLYVGNKTSDTIYLKFKLFDMLSLAIFCTQCVVCLKLMHKK